MGLTSVGERCSDRAEHNDEEHKSDRGGPASRYRSSPRGYGTDWGRLASTGTTQLQRPVARRQAGGATDKNREHHRSIHRKTWFAGRRPWLADPRIAGAVQRGRSDQLRGNREGGQCSYQTKDTEPNASGVTDRELDSQCRFVWGGMRSLEETPYSLCLSAEAVPAIDLDAGRNVSCAQRHEIVLVSAGGRV